MSWALVLLLLARGANLALLLTFAYVLWDFWTSDTARRQWDEEKLLKAVAFTILLVLAFVGIFIR